MNLAWCGLDIFYFLQVSLKEARTVVPSYAGSYWYLRSMNSCFYARNHYNSAGHWSKYQTAYTWSSSFCKFNFIFFEDHSNMLKVISFFPYMNKLLLLKNIFSSIEYRAFSLPYPHTQNGQKCIRNCVILWLWKQVMFCVRALFCWCLTKSKTKPILKLLLLLKKKYFLSKEPSLVCLILPGVFFFNSFVTDTRSILIPPSTSLNSELSQFGCMYVNVLWEKNWKMSVVILMSLYERKCKIEE